MVIRDAIRQHAIMCVDNASDELHAMELSSLLDKEIEYRVKQYGKYLSKVTKDYVKWLAEDYRSRLKILIHKIMSKRKMLITAG